MFSTQWLIMEQMVELAAIVRSMSQVACGYLLVMFTEKFLRICQEMVYARRTAPSVRLFVKEMALRILYLVFGLSWVLGSLTMFRGPSLGIWAVLAGVALRAPRFYRKGKAEGWLEG
jgi:hypothetical protein